MPYTSIRNSAFKVLRLVGVVIGLFCLILAIQTINTKCVYICYVLFIFSSFTYKEVH
jgi:hypothetical protein